MKMNEDETVEAILKTLVDLCPFVDKCPRQCTPTDRLDCWDKHTRSLLPLVAGYNKPTLTAISGAELITKERQRQIEQEGWSAEHDDEHTEGQLAIAAACYAFDAVALPTIDSKRFICDNWPWSRQWWNPTPDDTIRQLTKAGALIAAEIDRLLRLAHDREGK